MSPDRKPDWNYWSYIPNVSILQGVALSLDIDPNRISYHVRDGTMGFKELNESREFQERMILVIKNIDKLTVKKTVWDAPEKNEVTVASLGALMLAINRAIPPEMEALAARESDVAPSTKWPWGSRETKLLGHLAEAARELWSLYDPTEATTAPTNLQVRNFLEKRNVPKRIAEVMAQILRADELPKGNRKR